MKKNHIGISLYQRSLFAALTVCLVICGWPCRSDATSEPDSGTWRVVKAGEELRIMYGRAGSVLQYAALHCKDSYFRMNYGPGSVWGTSVVLLPIFWSGGRNYQGAPVSASWQTSGANLLLSLDGRIAGLTCTIEVCIFPPAEETIVADVSVRVKGRQALDMRDEGAFKLLMLSSMRISKNAWDAQALIVDRKTYPIAESGRIVPSRPFFNSRKFGLVGGTSPWKRNAPSICVILDKKHRVTGWVTPSSDPDDHNVGVFATANKIESSYSYRIIVTSEHGISNCIRAAEEDLRTNPPRVIDL